MDLKQSILNKELNSRKNMVTIYNLAPTESHYSVVLKSQMRLRGFSTRLPDFCYNLSKDIFQFKILIGSR